MSWRDDDEDRDLDDDLLERNDDEEPLGWRGLDADPLPPRWPLDWRGLLPRERWLWFVQLWEDTCALRRRYRLPVRTEWWANAIQVEALAALASWVERYDGGEWDDPPGKLALLYELERVADLLRDGLDPFAPDRDEAAFRQYLHEIGCEPPQAC